MKSNVTIVGLILIVVGIVLFAYQGFTYTSREKVAQLGDLQLTADTQKKVFFSPWVGGLSVAAGIVLVVIGRVGRPK